MTTCQKKHYPDQRSARVALESILKKDKLKTAKTPGRVYPCETCDGWHLTKKPLSGKIPPWENDPNWVRPDAPRSESDRAATKYKKQDKLIRALVREYNQLSEHGRVEFALSAPHRVYRAFGALMFHAQQTRDD
jgi:hypothetical protein